MNNTTNKGKRLNTMKMKTNKRAKPGKYTRNSKHKHIIGLLFSGIVLILPLIVRLKIIRASAQMYAYYPLNNGFVVDLVVYYKNIFFIITASLLTMFFIGERIFPDNPIPTGLMKYSRNKKYMVLSFIFLSFIVISYVFSEHKDVSLLGAPNSYEGTLTWVGYIIIFLLSINYFDDHFYINYIEKSITKILIIISIIGLIEYFWKSPLETKLLQHLVLPKEQWNQLGQLKITSYLGRITTTLSNPNYMGQFLVLIMPIFFKSLFNQDSHKNSYRHILYIGISFISILTLFISGAKAAIFAFFVGLLIQLLLFRKHPIFKSILVILSVSLILFIITFSIQQADVLNRLLRNKPEETDQMQNDLFINEINLEKKGVVIKGTENQLTISYNQEKGIDIYLNDQPMPFSRNENQYRLEGEEFSGVEITDYGTYFGVILKGNSPVYLTKRNGIYYALGPNGYLIDKINNKPGIGLDKRILSFATGRGYIWDISIPLLRNTVVKGYGADTGVFYIPQNDFAGKLNYHRSANMVIDKPHNIFIQIALNLGMASLVVFFIMLLIYYKTCYKIAINLEYARNNQELYYLFVSILSGVTNYLICSFFYDSNVSVAPIFWVLLGMGIAINNKILDLNCSLHQYQQLPHNANLS
jgi:O-antigen ligase